MRTVLNISLPKAMADEVKREVKDGKFASTSEFFRHILRVWNTEKLYKDLQESKRDFEKGDYKVLKSLKDLR